MSNCLCSRISSGFGGIASDPWVGQLMRPVTVIEHYRMRGSAPPEQTLVASGRV